MWPIEGEEVARWAEAAGADGAGPVAGRPSFEGVWLHGATGNVGDVRTGDLFVALPFADGDAHAGVERALCAGAAMALVSREWAGLASLGPALLGRCVAVGDVVRSFREIARRFRERLSYPVVAIGGCNGKTTTKEMLAAMLAAPGRRVVRTPGTDNGFLGLPQTLCDRRHRADDRPDALVLEIGIDATGAMESHVHMAAPDLVVVTALGAEHLDGLGDVESAVREELLLLERAPGARRVLPWGDAEIRSRPRLVRERDVAVVPEGASDEGARDWPPAGAVLSFRGEARGESSDVTVAWYPDRDPSRPAWRGRLRVPMPGAHNAQNCALAAAGALALGWSPEEVLEGWAGFSPPPWRSRVVALDRGAVLLDDCFNANPASVRAALSMLDDPAWAGRPKVAVLGDMLDLGAEPERWHRELAEPLSRVSGLRAFLFGRAMGRLKEELGAIGNAASVSGCLAAGDPVELIAGVDFSPGTVFLVKGSRGMRMERVSRYLEVACSRDRAAARRAVSDAVTTVGIVGSSGLAETAQAVSAALRSAGPVGAHGRRGTFIDEERITAASGARGGFEAACRCFVRGVPHLVVELWHEQLLASLEEGDIHVAVYTGLSDADLPEGGDLERHLAEKAQVLARGRSLVAAVLCADDPTSELIAEVVPPSVRVFRYGTAEAGRGPMDLCARSIEVTGAGTRVTLAGSGLAGDLRGIEVPERGKVFGLGAMAGLLVARALGALRGAAGHLC
jgi:UDP-N-acetylmuramoyl-tripeptide--D-alanyl-D-alanine ligase